MTRRRCSNRRTSAVGVGWRSEIGTESTRRVARPLGAAVESERVTKAEEFGHSVAVHASTRESVSGTLPAVYLVLGRHTMLLVSAQNRQTQTPRRSETTRVEEQLEGFVVNVCIYVDADGRGGSGGEGGLSGLGSALSVPREHSPTSPTLLIPLHDATVQSLHPTNHNDY